MHHANSPQATSDLFAALLADTAATVRDVFPNATAVTVYDNTGPDDEGPVWYVGTVLFPDGQDPQLNPAAYFSRNATATWDATTGSWTVTTPPADEDDSPQVEDVSMHMAVWDILNEADGPFLTVFADRFYNELRHMDNEPVTLQLP